MSIQTNFDPYEVLMDLVNNQNDLAREHNKSAHLIHLLSEKVQAQQLTIDMLIKQAEALNHMNEEILKKMFLGDINGQASNH